VWPFFLELFGKNLTSVDKCFVTFTGQLRTTFLILFKLGLLFLSDIDDITPALVNLLNFEHHFNQINIPVKPLHQVFVVELHEEGPYSFANVVHVNLDPVRHTADSGDAFQHHA